MTIIKNWLFLWPSGLFVKGKINQSNSNNSKKKNYLCLCNLSIKIHNCSSSNNSSALMANANDTIAATILYVNTIGSLVTKILANQPANKLEQAAENTFNWAVDSLKDNPINDKCSMRGSIHQ